jgi:L-iditol 2-dehydrogenase
MKAVVKTRSGEGHVMLKDWPEPSAAADEIKLKIGAAGICGTDLHIIKGSWPCQVPVVIGHEFCGTVVEVGSQVSLFKPGDRVVGSNPARTCGACSHCRAGNPFMCSSRVSAGYMIDGAFAEYFCIAAERCHALPPQVTFRQAALGEPLAVAVRAVFERTVVRPGDVVLVSGVGCVGLLTLQLARLAGAKVIAAGVDKDELRLNWARDLGADWVVNTSREDLAEVVSGCTEGEGADLVYECAGVSASVDHCLDAVKKEGTLVALGILSGPIQTFFSKITLKELRVVGSYGYVWSSWERAIYLLSENKVRTEELISHEFPLHRFEDAFLAAQDGSAVKVIFDPSLA